MRELLKGYCEFIRIDMVRAGLEDLKELVLIFPIALIIGLVYFLIRRKRRGKAPRGSLHGELLRFMFAVYAAALFMLTLLPSGIFEKLLIFAAYGQWTSVPYDISSPDFYPEFLYLFTGYYGISALLNANNMLNIALFIPFGTAAPFIWKKLSFFGAVVIGAGLSLFIETVQVFIMRDPNINDVICNTLGTAIGCCICCLLKKLFPGFSEKLKVS